MNWRQYLSIISISPTLFVITWKVWEVQPETLKLSSELMHQIKTRCSLSAGPDTCLNAWLQAANLHEARFSVAHFPEESDLTDVTQPWLHYLLKGSCCCCCCCYWSTIMSVRAVLWQHEETIGTRKKLESTRARWKSHVRLTVRATLYHIMFFLCVKRRLYLLRVDLLLLGTFTQQWIHQGLLGKLIRI